MMSRLFAWLVAAFKASQQRVCERLARGGSATIE
jgi:hypothetical protein